MTMTNLMITPNPLFVCFLLGNKTVGF